MGTIYLGPYADEVNHPREHEGYAADIVASGQPALVAACSCGWTSPHVRPHGPEDSPGRLAVEADFESEHLAPLVEQVTRNSWPNWAARTRARLSTTVEHVAQGRLRSAARVLDDLRQDLAHRISIINALIDEQDYADHLVDEVLAAVPDLVTEPRPRPFGPVTDPATPAPHPPGNPAPTSHHGRPR